MKKKLNDFRDLLFEKNSIAHVAIIRKGGIPHVTPVWFDLTEEDLKNSIFKFNSAKGRVKTSNLRINSSVSISILDPEDPYRYLGLNGKIIKVIEGDEAVKHIHELSVKYTGKEFWNIKENPNRIKYIVKILSLF